MRWCREGGPRHTLGAAGAVEAIVVGAFRRQRVRAAHHGLPAQPDPDCPVNVLTEAKMGYPQKVALSNSLGFGGHNAVLAISPF